MPPKKKVPAPAKALPVQKKVVMKKAVSAPVAMKTVKKVPVKPAVTTMKKPVVTVSKGWNLRAQFAIAGSAIAVLLLLGAVDRVTFSTNPSDAASVPATVGIEHVGPLRLSFLIARKQIAGYTSITNNSNETIHVSVPSDWSRNEVTGASLDDVTSDIPVFGFTRWTLPPRAGIKMLMSRAPAVLNFESTSRATAEIDLQTIDLTDLHASTKVILLKDQVMATLWGDEE